MPRIKGILNLFGIGNLPIKPGTAVPTPPAIPISTKSPPAENSSYALKAPMILEENLGKNDVVDCAALVLKLLLF